MTRDTVTSLMELCLESSLQYLESCSCTKSTLTVPDNVFLPEDVCEALVSRMIQQGKCNDAFLLAFSNPQTSRLVRARLQNTPITEKGVAYICKQPLRDVNLSFCFEVTDEGIEHLTECKNTLLSLSLVGCYGIRDFSIIASLSNLRLLDLSSTYIDQEDFDLLGTSLDNLRSLKLKEASITDLSPVSAMKNLVSLDISCCIGVKCIKHLENIKGSLEWLCLFNCLGLEDFVEPMRTIEQLRALQHLDLSLDVKEDELEIPVKHAVVDCSMLKVLSTLPRLTSLDLSGTADFTVDDLDCFQQRHHTLQFFGLSMTKACRFPGLPAHEVAGESCAKQLVTSLKVYKNRPKLLINAMRELFNLIRHGNRDVPETVVCNYLLQAMEIHQADYKIQMAGSASLYHLSHDDLMNNPEKITQEQRRHIVKVTLDAMEKHIAERQLQKNCCLTLCNFKIPQEVEFDYQRVARILLKSATCHNEDFIQRIAVGLCNLLVCQVSDERKVVVGKDLHGVEMILKVISKKLEDEHITADVLECCWSALWNVTDETEENCALFIQLHGMEIFLSCNQRLGNQRNLLRNMLGLMGNVAEVKRLRPYLMTQAHIFCELLVPDDDLEVSYNAAGILSHLASDGAAAWTNSVIPRQQAMSWMIRAINNWELSTARQMSYRSFVPILRLLPHHDTPAIQQWAAWALANLSTVDPPKYCGLIRDEGGLPLLQELVSNPRTNTQVRKLAGATLETCCQNLMDSRHEEYSRTT